MGISLYLKSGKYIYVNGSKKKHMEPIGHYKRNACCEW